MPTKMCNAYASVDRVYTASYNMLTFSTSILSKPVSPSNWSGFSFERSGIGVLMPAFSSSFKRFSLVQLHVPHEGAIQMASMLSADSSMNCTR